MCPLPAHCYLDLGRLFQAHREAGASTGAFTLFGGIEMYVARIEFSDGQQPVSGNEAVASLTLRWLDKPTQLMRFDAFLSERVARATSPEAYRLLFEVKGHWTDAPTHAVYAEWQVNDPKRAAGFEESRRKLFGLRRQVLATFAYDWLLQRLDRKGRYLVLGLYGDEEGATRLCRAHPEIQRFAQANPIANFAAVDLTGLCCFRVEAHSPGGGRFGI